MGVGSRKSEWITKPPQGTALANTALCNGIIFCASLNETSGYPSDAVTNRISVPGSAAPTWVSGQRGAALNYPGVSNNELFKFVNDARYVINPTEMTIACIVNPVTWAPSANESNLINSPSAFEFYFESFAGHGYAGFTIANWTGGNKNMRYLNTSPSLNVWHSLVGVITNSLPSAIYVDGVSGATTTATAVQAQVLTNELFLGGNGGATTVGASKIRQELAVMWNRALTATEIVQFNANPYQIFQPRRTYFNLAAVSSTQQQFTLMGCGS